MHSVNIVARFEVNRPEPPTSIIVWVGKEAVESFLLRISIRQLRLMNNNERDF